jgi:hypothetical protein
MTRPVVLDEQLMSAWMDALAHPVAGSIPDALIDRWRAGLVAAVAEAREPAPSAVTGRHLVLDRYLTGVAAGLAAAVATSAPSDGAASDPIILAAGLLAGSAAVQAVPSAAGWEVAAGSAAAAAMVDAAATGAGVAAAVGEALRAATQVRSRTMVGIALEALLRGIAGDPAEAEPDELFQVRLTLEPVDPRYDLETVALDRMLDGLSEERRWIPDGSGFRLVVVTRRPGPVVETVFGYGRVRGLDITHLH